MKNTYLNESGLSNLSPMEKQDSLREQLLLDAFTLKDFSDEITQRKMNVWHNQGLLLEKSDKGKWRKFNFIEFCWIHLVNELRNFEIGFTIIKSLREELIKPINTDHLFEDEGMKEMLELVPEENRPAMKELLANQKFRDVFKKGLKWRINVSIFYMLVFNAILQRKHTSICFLRNGFFLPVTINDLDDPKQLIHVSELLNHHYFSISLNNIISKFLTSKYFDDPKSKLHLLEKHEEEILKQIRLGNCKMIEIRFRKGKPELIEITTTGIPNASARISDLMMIDGYQDIKITTDKGKVVNYENTRKIKL